MAALFPATANAQSIYGQRLQGANGWLLPVASRLLCSDSAMHVRRGSIPSWDICTPQGSAIYPAAPGRVIYAGCNNAGGYGCWVKLDHGNGITSAYAHMVNGSITVQAGQAVTQDMVIGQVGWTGMTSFGPHVHFVIYKDGVHVDPAQVFSQQAMQFCDKCASPGNGPVAAAGTVQAGGMAQQAIVTSPGQRILTAVTVAMVGMGGQLVAVLFVAILATLWAFWLASNAVRVVMASAIVATACSVAVVVSLSPVQVSAAPSDFEIAYRIVRGEEGRGCDTYIVNTLNGVTQWTYDRYNMERGTERREVCTHLTEGETRDIYHRYYWQPSGAAQLPVSAAIQVFDHAINAGVGEGKKLIGACGNDATCIARQRISFYQSTKTCLSNSDVCRAWLRRVRNVYTVSQNGGFLW